MLRDVQRYRLPGGQPGVELAALDWGGDGPLVLCHHANGFCAAMWDEVAEGLRGACRVVAYDARGHGDSTRPADLAWLRFADDAAAAATALGARLGRPVALGLASSFGGTSFLLAAAREPAAFERLLLLDPVLRVPGAHPELPPGVSPGAHLAERARKRRSHWPSRAAARRAWSARELFAAWTPGAVDLYLAEGLRDRPDGTVELKCPPEVEAAIFAQGPPTEVFERAPAIRAPTRLVRAARGSFAAATYAALARGMPDAAVEEVDCGHLIPMERPAWVSERVRRALQGSRG